MERKNFSQFYEKPCKFRLKSGKEVYGVIWEDSRGREKEHYFASFGEYMDYIKARKANDKEACEKLKLRVNIQDIIAAETVGEQTSVIS